MAQHREFKQDNMYIVELQDIDWYGKDVDTALVCEQFRQRARADECEILAIFVIPDPLFPICDLAIKHKVYEYRSAVANAATFKVEAMFTGNIDEEMWPDDEGARRKLLGRVRDEVNKKARGVAGRYVIQLIRGSAVVARLEQGRV